MKRPRLAECRPVALKRDYEPPTRLARARLEAGVTQLELAKVIGISIASYRRLERGVDRDPPIGWLANAAIALGYDFESLCDHGFDEWRPYNNRRPPDSDWLERPLLRERAERWRRSQEEER